MKNVSLHEGYRLFQVEYRKMAATQVLARPVELPKYEQIAVTEAELDWADLVTLDLEDFERPGGKERLTTQLFDAVQNIGFFYVINFGLSQDEVVSIALLC